MNRIISCVVLLVLVAGIAGCSDDEPAPAPPPGPKNADQLIPLEIGNTWVYAEKSPFGEVDARQSIAKLKTLLYQGGGTTPRAFYIDSADAVAYSIDATGVLFGQPKVAIGATEAVVTTFGIIPKNPTPGYVNGAYTYLGLDTLTTPAGTFQSAHRFEVSLGGGSSQIQTDWYQKGVGLLKRIVVDQTGDTVFSRILKSYILK